jgi:hypothetical protein
MNKCFGIQLDHAKPSLVKIKSPMLIIEIVKDSKSKKEGDAIQALMDKIDKEEKLTWGQ